MSLGVGHLRALDLFEDATDDEVQAWVAVAEDRQLVAGEVLVEEGTVAPGLHFLLEGTISTSMTTQGRREPVGRQHAPTWMGAIATLTEGPIGVRMEAEGPCHVVSVPARDAVRLALAQPSVHRRVMLQMAPVMNRIVGIEYNRERLTALGTMAAGLAHELNNPAAAARRAAAAKRTKLAALDASDAEDAVLDALEDAGVPDAWKLAPALAAGGVEPAWVGRVVECAGPASGAVLDWLAASLAANELASELIESTDRMSKLVGAVKSYAYMDRGGERADVDLHEGIETTLTVLGHKLKHTSIEVVREYERTLPRLHAFGSELNQVWTNLLDNAIDALGDSGTITVRTVRDGDCVEVSVADDGPGIDADARDRIFEPFFTTKDVGAGTRLGLDAARRIIIDRHGGSMRFESEPGRTVFTVRLPLGGVT